MKTNNKGNHIIIGVIIIALLVVGAVILLKPSLDKWLSKDGDDGTEFNFNYENQVDNSQSEVNTEPFDEIEEDSTTPEEINNESLKELDNTFNQLESEGDLDLELEL